MLTIAIDTNSDQYCNTVLLFTETKNGYALILG